MKKINVLIVDDRDVIRDSLKLIFLNSKSIQIKDDASDGLEAMELLEKNNYDVVLMDVSMPNMNGIEATKRIKAIDPSVKVLANSFHISPFVIRDMIKAGASGFIKKGETKNAYAEAIEAVYNGDIYLSDEINHKIYDKVLTYFKPSSGKRTLST